MTTITISDGTTLRSNNVYDLNDGTVPSDGGGTAADKVIVNNTNLIASSHIKFYTYFNSDVFDFSSAFAQNAHDVYSGAGNDRVTGGASAEFVYDGSGNDVYLLGGGADKIFAGAGNDTYDGGAGKGDTLSFLSAITNTAKGDPGFAQNSKGVTVSLNKSTAQATVFGSDIIKGFENLVGGNGADKLTGNSAANDIDGNKGGDTIYGLGGKDVLRPNDGKDTVIGGAGADSIDVGGDSSAAMDKIRYTKASDSTLTAFDTITFFAGGGTATSDRIDLSAFKGSAKLLWKGTGGFGTTSAGEVRWKLVDSEHKINVFVDLDSDQAAEMKIVVDVFGSTLTSLVKADFIL